MNQFYEEDFANKVLQYYCFMLVEIKRNKELRDALMSPHASKNILTLTGKNIGEKILEMFEQETKTRSIVEQRKTNASIITSKAHVDFSKELMKNNIFIKNAMEIKTDNSMYRTYEFAQEYETKEHFELEKNALKNIFAKMDNDATRLIVANAIKLVYQGAFKSCSYQVKKGDAYFKECNGILSNFEEDKKYWINSVGFKENEQNDPNIEITNRRKLLSFKSKTLFLSSNLDKAEIVMPFLKEVETFKKFWIENDPSKEKNIIKLINSTFLDDIYKYANKENTQIQKEYMKILFPLMGKKRETGLSILKSEFTRNKNRENDLMITKFKSKFESEEEKDKIFLNLLIEFKKTNVVLSNFFDRTFIVQNENGLDIKLTKLSQKTISFSVLVNQEEIKDFNTENLLDLKEKFRDLIIETSNNLINNVKTGTVSNNELIHNLSVEFKKELRAIKIISHLENVDKTTKVKNKI